MAVHSRETPGRQRASGHHAGPRSLLAFGGTGSPCPGPGPRPTLLWLLLTLAAGREQSGVPPKASLLATPGSTAKMVTLRCRAPGAPAGAGGVAWYRDDRLWPKETEEICVMESGDYRCRTQGSSFSDGVRVRFFADWMFFQSPHPVFEGDNVTLRCRMKNARDETYYKDGRRLGAPPDSGGVTLHAVSRDDSTYHCRAPWRVLGVIWKEETSPSLRIHVQELFPRPVLTASPAQPTEGDPVTLTCDTRLPPERSRTPLHFCFFRGDRVLGPGWSGSPELWVPAVWGDDRGSYWCQARTATHSVVKTSLRSPVRVRRVPVSGVQLETRPPGGQLTEGDDLVLVCSVAEGTGTVTFSWFREGTVSLGRRTRRSQAAELQLPRVGEQDAGSYSCAASNTHGPVSSPRVSVTVRLPASRPVLTLGVPGARAVAGTVLELRCEAGRGSPPILYRFYHEDVSLGSSAAPSGGGASLNLSLTAEHSGNYSCEADNGLGARRSEVVPLRVTDGVPVHGVPERKRGPSHSKVTLTVGVAGALLGVLGLAAVAARVGQLRSQRSSGGRPAAEAPRLSPSESPELSWARPPTSHPGGLICSDPPALEELQPVYSNVGPQDVQDPGDGQGPRDGQGPQDGHLVYSQVWGFQHTKQRAEGGSPRTRRQESEPAVIYSELRRGVSGDVATQAGSGGSTHEDGAENYENVSCASSALRH